MQLLSVILKEMNRTEECFNEQEFERLALMVSDIEYKTCTFIESEHYVDQLKKNVTMVITPSAFAEEVVSEGRGVIICENPRILFFKIHNYLRNNQEYSGKKFPSQIDGSAEIAQFCDISSTNVVIGKNVTVESFVKIYPNVYIGDNSIIRSGAVLGGEGFEFKREGDEIMSVIHLGSVEIGENVEIQNNTCVDKAVYPWDKTIIGDYSKVDNLVYIAHAVKVGKRVMIVANSGIGGRTEINEDTWIGLGATLKNGITVGCNARANMGSVVTKPILDSQSVTGNFAIEHKKFIDNMKKQL